MAPQLPEPTDETTRLTLQKLLDLASAFDESTGALSPEAFEIVMAELTEIGAVSMTYDDEDPKGTRVVSIGPLVSALGFILGLLVEYAADQSGQDRLAVIASIRHVVDELH